MTIEQEVHNDIIVFKLTGDVMGGPEAVKVNEEINRMLDEGALKAIIDLDQVGRMNSSGLGILINALTTYKQNGGSLKLAGASPVVANLLKITRLNTIFESYDTTDAALGSFAT